MMVYSTPASPVASTERRFAGVKIHCAADALVTAGPAARIGDDARRNATPHRPP